MLFFLKKRRDKRGEGSHNTFSGIIILNPFPHSSHSLLSLPPWTHRKKNSPFSPRVSTHKQKEKYYHCSCKLHRILSIVHLSFPTFSSNQIIEIYHFISPPFSFFINHSNQTHPKCHNLFKSVVFINIPKYKLLSSNLKTKKINLSSKVIFVFPIKLCIHVILHL